MATLSLQIFLSMLKACDGLFLNTAPAYDGETLVALEAWIKDSMDKPVYVVGPLLPPGYGTEQIQTLPGKPADAGIASFLNSMRSQHGEKSVLFVRRDFSVRTGHQY